MPENERILMNNGAASCVAVQGGVNDPAVLLIGSSMLSWPDELVAGGQRVIRYDVRDTGRLESYPPGEPGYSLADLVDDTVAVLDATVTERAHVAGMSTCDDQHRLRRPRPALARAPRRHNRADARPARRGLPFFTIGNGEALAAEIPDARLVRLGRAGHRLPARIVPIVAEEFIPHTAG